MEFVCHSIKISPPTSLKDGKTLHVLALEIKSAQDQFINLQEAILHTKIIARRHGLFIPAPFFKKVPTASHNTYDNKHTKTINELIFSTCCSV